MFALKEGALAAASFCGSASSLRGLRGLRQQIGLPEKACIWGADASFREAMMVGTHSLLPVCGCLLADKISIAAGRLRMFSGRNLLAVGFFGFLPDILSPHLSLESRQSSLSHTLWAVMAVALIVGPLVGFTCRKGSRLPVAIACWIAYVLHLAADAISGGIVWLYPWRDDVLGRYWVPAPQWIWYDAGFILLVWAIYRVFPHFSKGSRPPGSDRLS